MKEIRLLYQVKENNKWSCKDMLIFIPLTVDPHNEIKYATIKANEKLEKMYVEFKKM